MVHIHQHFIIKVHSGSVKGFECSVIAVASRDPHVTIQIVYISYTMLKFRFMLEEIPYTHLASVTDEEPPTHHSLLLNMVHRVSKKIEKGTFVKCMLEVRSLLALEHSHPRNQKVKCNTPLSLKTADISIPILL